MSIDNVSISAHNPNYPPRRNENKNNELNPVERTVVSSVAPARRLCDIPNMIKSGDTLAAAGLGGLTLVSLPEDCRDLRAASVIVDINGIKPPNTYGKDVFKFDINFEKGVVKPICSNDETDDINQNCKNSGSCCAAKIIRDGWEISDDYPW